MDNPYRMPTTFDPAPLAEPARPKPGSWWGRNWKWVVPVGVLVPTLVCGGLVSLVFMVAFGALKNIPPYAQAMDRAGASPRVTAALGSPIEDGFPFTGNIEVNPTSGYADIAIPISGPSGDGTLYVEAQKSGGTWRFSTLEVVVAATDETIDLLE